GHTGFAAWAVWPVQVLAAAAKAQLGQAPIDVLVDRLTRVQKQGDSLLLVQVAAIVGLGRIKLQVRQVGHLAASGGNASSIDAARTASTRSPPGQQSGCWPRCCI